MVLINVHDAKTRLSELIEKALAGERVVVCKRNVPLAEIVPVEKRGLSEPLSPAYRVQPMPTRQLGLAKELLTIAPGAFEPWTQEELDEMLTNSNDPLQGREPKNPS
jgi:prevent-host-death family protein